MQRRVVIKKLNVNLCLLLNGLASFFFLIWQGELNLYVTQNQSTNENCGLALDNSVSEEGVDRVSMLIDDEELELRELQEGTNLFRCSNHLAASGMLVCSLCKGNLEEQNLTSIPCYIQMSNDVMKLECSDSD